MWLVLYIWECVPCLWKNSEARDHCGGINSVCLSLRKSAVVRRDEFYLFYRVLLLCRGCTVSIPELSTVAQMPWISFMACFRDETKVLVLNGNMKEITLSGSGDIKLHPSFSPHLPAHPVEIGGLQRCTPPRCKHDLGVNRPSLFPQETLPTCLNTSNHFKKWVGCYGKTCIISACFFFPHWRNEFSVFKRVLLVSVRDDWICSTRKKFRATKRWERLSLHIILRSYHFS